MNREIEEDIQRAREAIKKKTIFGVKAKRRLIGGLDYAHWK